MTRATKTLYERAYLPFVFMLLMLTVAGCNTTGGYPSTVCEAMIGPIKYNSVNPKSQRYAAPALAPDLAVRNRVGITLKCPEY